MFLIAISITIAIFILWRHSFAGSFGTLGVGGAGVVVGGTNALLLEDGSYLLLEDGSNFGLEQ